MSIARIGRSEKTRQSLSNGHEFEVNADVYTLEGADVSVGFMTR